MKKVLLVTTQSAQSVVWEIAQSLRRNYQIDIYVSSAVVAQFTSCDELAVELQKYLNRCDYDIVLIPGLVRGSTEAIERAIGCEVYKGPRYAGDIPLALDLIGKGFKLSKEVPADILHKEFFSSHLLSRYSWEALSKKPQFELRGIKVFLDPPPMKLLLEVMASDVELFNEKVARAAESGFSGVVIGCSSRCNYTVLEKYVDRARGVDGVHIVGVDTPRVSDIPRDLLEKVDIVFNVTHLDIEGIASELSRDKAVVVIPSTLESTDRAIQSIEAAVSELREVGLEKIIVDPLIKPPGAGLAESITRFYYSKKCLSYPHLFSTANIYELIDADSHGVIALLLVLALELGASLVLATEESTKSFGAIEEHSIARYMAYVSYFKKSPPKDVPEGVDLLVVKGKKLKKLTPPEFKGCVRYVDLVEPREDPNYFVKVYVDYTQNALVVDVFSAKSGEILERFVGSHPTSLARAVLRKYELLPEHSSYLGYELCRAELALKFRKDYEQDRSVVTPPIDRIREYRDSLTSLP
ncbi:MAG: dihydropteroate synthase-like protein [Sulfolobales archaeon]|nr:dihydropteroate synthase-like protein [Sulfolobales archaeon]MDW8082585.1 dihydropteroate synthase-like protein [Sulfolobales archaeon]